MAVREMVGDAAPRHRSYLLRLWETRSVPEDGTAAWRFSLEDLQSSERHGFASLEDMVSFLNRATDGRPGMEALAATGAYPEEANARPAGPPEQVKL